MFWFILHFQIDEKDIYMSINLDAWNNDYVYSYKHSHGGLNGA